MNEMNQHGCAAYGKEATRKGIGYRPVTLVAEPPLQAEIMISSSMMVSLILGLPDCTMKTSFSRTLFEILTLVSPYCK